MTDIDNGYDEQDRAEALDEDMVGRDGELRTFEELPDVLDVTTAVGDADDDDGLTAEELDDSEIVDLEEQADPGDSDAEDDVRPHVFNGE